MTNKTGIITIGDEILIGQIINTNVAWLGEQLTLAGMDIGKTWTVGDNLTDIITTLDQAVKEADWIVITGGLGPTRDDVTKKAIADYLGVPLSFHQPTFDHIKNYFDRIGRQMSPSHVDQCDMPKGVTLLHNRLGTAPGMLFTHKGKTLVSLPGVPYEMKAIWQEEVTPILQAHQKAHIAHITLLTAGEGETTIENRIRDIVDTFPETVSIAYLPSLGQVRVRITGRGASQEDTERLVKEEAEKIYQRLADIVYGTNASNMEREVLTLCRTHGLTLGTAESCTGGAIAAKIVSVPGSSDCFMGSVVCYSNEMKTRLLQVPVSTLAEHGAVSEETVIEMLKGAIHALNVDVAVSVSGIAGPDGGTANKPVGTIWICAGNENNYRTALLKAGKDRQMNIEIAVNGALNLVRKWILSQAVTSEVTTHSSVD